MKFDTLWYLVMYGGFAVIMVLPDDRAIWGPVWGVWTGLVFGLMAGRHMGRKEERESQNR